MPRRSSKGNPPAKGGGRGKKKRAYTMSAAARAQRRVAGRKHGRRAATPARQLLPGCTRNQCPLRDAAGKSAYPCTMKKTANESGQVIESCPLPLAVNPELRDRFVRALDGDVDGLREITAASLAAQSTILASELEQLRREGFVIDTPAMVVGEGEVIYKKAVNPRAAPTFTLLEHLGHTAAQQAITPKSQGEKKRDDGVGGMLAAITAMHERLDGATPARELDE